MEWTVSGYCRNLDQSRMVMIEKENDQWELDCDFPACAFSSSCPIGKQIQQIQEEYP